MNPKIADSLSAVLQRELRPQRAFTWNRSSWQDTLRDSDEILDQLARLPAKVDRDAVRTVVAKNLAGGRPLAAFVAAEYEEVSPRID
jgi:hypothetical protein